LPNKLISLVVCEWESQLVHSWSVTLPRAGLEAGSARTQVSQGRPGDGEGDGPKSTAELLFRTGSWCTAAPDSGSYVPDFYIAHIGKLAVRRKQERVLGLREGQRKTVCKREPIRLPAFLQASQPD